MPIVILAGRALVYAPASNPGAADVWDDDWNYTINRSDAVATVVSAFASGGGYDDVFNIENGTAETTGGWLYTVDSIPGFVGSFPQSASRVLCVETNPRLTEDLYQSDPSLQMWAETSPAGTIPADVWIQFWQYNCRSGAQQSTFDVRDKVFYITQSDPPYPSTDFPWLMLQGAGGFNYNPPPNNIDNFLALQSQRSAVPYDAGNDPIGYQKMFQNLSEAVITPNAWFQVRMHIDTSGAQGSAEMWIRERGTPSFTKVMEWLPGVTQYDPGVGGPQTFQWPTSAADRAGAKVLRWPSTTNGQDNHAFRHFGRLEIATAENLLSTGD